MGLIRFLLALSIVFIHVKGGQVQLASAAAAVQSFFVISGFYIAMALDNAYAFSPFAFYKNRFFRIYPVYWVVAALTVLLVVTGSTERFRGFGALPIAAQAELAMSNVLLFGQDWIMFSGLDTRGLHFVTDFRTSSPEVWTYLLAPPAWSLGVELTFYLLAPWLLRLKTPALVGVALISLGVRAGLSGAGLYADPWSYRFFPSELALFIMGALVYRGARMHGVKSLRRAPAVLMLIAICALILSYQSMPVPGAAKYAVLTVSIAICMPFLFARFKNSKLDKAIGDLSYPLYISHWLAIEALESAIGQPTSMAGAIGFAAFTVAFAAILVWAVDKRLGKIRSRVRSVSERAATRPVRANATAL